MSEIFSTVSGFFTRLRSHERKTFRRFLDLHEDSSQVDSKSVLLYDLLNENPNIDEEDAVLGLLVHGSAWGSGAAARAWGSVGRTTVN